MLEHRNRNHFTYCGYRKIGTLTSHYDANHRPFVDIAVPPAFNVNDYTSFHRPIHTYVHNNRQYMCIGVSIVANNAVSSFTER